MIEVASRLPRPLQRAQVEIEDAFGRILASPVLADRDYPPFLTVPRATASQFAPKMRKSPVRASIASVRLRAGGQF